MGQKTIAWMIYDRDNKPVSEKSRFMVYTTRKEARNEKQPGERIRKVRIEVIGFDD